MKQPMPANRIATKDQLRRSKKKFGGGEVSVICIDKLDGVLQCIVCESHAGDGDWRSLCKLGVK